MWIYAVTAVIVLVSVMLVINLRLAFIESRRRSVRLAKDQVKPGRNTSQFVLRYSGFDEIAQNTAPLGGVAHRLPTALIIAIPEFESAPLNMTPPTGIAQMRSQQMFEELAASSLAANSSAYTSVASGR